MTKEAQIKSVALFYYFALLDDSLARYASEITLRKCKKQIEKSNVKRQNIPALIVEATNKNWEKFLNSKFRSHPGTATEDISWRVSDKIDLGLWKEYVKKADSTEMLALVWSKVLGFDDEQIAEGLGVTEGTVRHRVGRALRDLGQLRK